MTRWRTLLLALAASCSHGTHREPAEPKVGERQAGRPAVLDGGERPVEGAAQAPAPEPGAVTPAQRPAKVKIMIRTNPPKGIWVFWGKKKLGMTPLNIERPRDSGPVDLVLRAQGFFPMHTRAYTTKNDLIGIKMIKLTDRMAIYGAKQEIPPETPPEAAPTTTATTPTTIDPLAPAPTPATP